MTRKKTDAFTRLTQALEVLPNVGPKSARRMAYELLRHKREGAAELAAAQADEQAAIARVAAARATLAHEGAAGESGARAPQPVLSPVSGVVLRRSLQSATPVAAGQSLMEVGDTAQLEIEAEVLSTDAVRLAPADDGAGGAGTGGTS